MDCYSSHPSPNVSAVIIYGSIRLISSLESCTRARRIKSYPPSFVCCCPSFLDPNPAATCKPHAPSTGRERCVCCARRWANARRVHAESNPPHPKTSVQDVCASVRPSGTVPLCERFIRGGSDDLKLSTTTTGGPNTYVNASIPSGEAISGASAPRGTLQLPKPRMRHGQGSACMIVHLGPNAMGSICRAQSIHTAYQAIRLVLCTYMMKDHTLETPFQ